MGVTDKIGEILLRNNIESSKKIKCILSYPENKSKIENKGIYIGQTKRRISAKDEEY